MTTWEMRVNVYNNSLPGHANVSFYENGEHQYTVGANILHETTKLALPQTLPFLPDDGIYRDESAYHLAELVAETVTWASVPLPEVTYDRLLSEARALENQTYNYSLLTEACVDLVAEFYAQTGHPGKFGDLFAAEDRHGSLVWMRVPTTISARLEIWPATEPVYVPTDLVYIDKLAVVEFSDFGLSPTNDDYPQFEKEWGADEVSEFGISGLDAEDGKVLDLAPTPKEDEVEASPSALEPTDSKADGVEIDIRQQHPPHETESNDDVFDNVAKKDHFEFALFESHDPKTDPSEEWNPPSTVEHKSPPPTTDVDFSRPEPEQTYVDPDYYGYF